MAQTSNGISGGISNISNIVQPKSTLAILMYIGLGLFLISFVLTLAAGVSAPIAFLWNLLAALSINYQLIPNSVVSSPFILFSSLLDAFTFALIAVALAAFFFEFVKQINIRKRFVVSKVKQMKQHIIIVPYNTFAHSLIKELKSTDERIVVIAENEGDATRLYHQNILAVVGDPKELEAFSLAGIGRAKYVIACADDDVQNALIAVTAKSANARAKIISRVSDIENIAKLGSAGAYRMIMPEVTTGVEMGEILLKKVI